MQARALSFSIIIKCLWWYGRWREDAATLNEGFDTHEGKIAWHFEKLYYFLQLNAI